MANTYIGLIAESCDMNTQLVPTNVKSEDFIIHAEDPSFPFFRKHTLLTQQDSMISWKLPRKIHSIRS